MVAVDGGPWAQGPGGWCAGISGFPGVRWAGPEPALGKTVKKRLEFASQSEAGLFATANRERAGWKAFYFWILFSHLQGSKLDSSLFLRFHKS